MTPGKYAPFILGALLLAALLLIQLSRNTNPASTGKPDGTSTVQPAPEELVLVRPSHINVNASLPDAQFRQLLEANKDFMMKYPHIQVKLTNEASKNKAYDLWTQQSQQGEAADVMLLDNAWVRPFAVRGFLKSADNVMLGDMLSDQMTGLLDPLKWNGYLWGVPRDVNPYIVVWSEALLMQAGLKEPPSDWAVYQDTAAKLIELNSKTSIVNWSDGDLLQQLLWLAIFQDDQSNLLNVQPLNEMQTAQLRWLKSMEKNISRIEADAIVEISEAFQGNKLLAAVIPWNDYEKLNEALRNKLIVDRDQIIYPWLNGRSYVISSSSNAEEEAMLWIQVMTDLNNQQMIYDRSGQLPARASFYASNSPLHVNQVNMPPAWWQKVLNAKLSDDNLPIPDPQWPVKWQQREQKWEMFSQESLQIDAYIDALAVSE